MNKFSYRWEKLRCFVKHYFLLWLYRLCSSTVRQQHANPKQIPIIIISFNQLTHLKQLVDFLISKSHEQIVIVDNNSTYPPLLAYFEHLDPRVTLHRLTENKGHLAFWKSDTLYRRYGKGYYVVTDADVLPEASCPDDYMSMLKRLLDKAYDRTKVGFSLRIDDLPVSNPNRERIIAWEKQFWKTSIDAYAFKAELDTTFALYRPYYKYRLKGFTKAWRTKPPYTATHGGWYIDIAHLTEEQRYYMATANASASWMVDAEGNLINTVHKPLYDHGSRR